MPAPGVPPELYVGLLAMLPVTELRVAIPVGILVFRLPVWETFIVAEIGTTVPIFVSYALCERIAKAVEHRRGMLHRWTHAFMHRSHRKLHATVQKWGPPSLAVFVGLPLPGTGVWNASVGAFLLHIKLRKALPYIVLGNLVAGVIMVLATTGAVAAFKVFVPAV